MQIIYPDVLFLINFCMDFIALYLSGVLMHAHRNKKHLLLSSFLGSVFSVFLLLFNVSGLVNVSIGFFISVLLCYVGYGEEVRKMRFFRLLIIFYVVSFMLGGAVTAFYNFLYEFFRQSDVRLEYEKNKVFVFMAVSALCALLLYFFANAFNSSSQEKVCNIIVRFAGKEKSFKGLVDSGNFLVDPFSRAPVIIMNISSMHGFLPNKMIDALETFAKGGSAYEEYSLTSLRIIPSNSLGGKKLLMAYKPEKIEIGVGSKEKNNVFRVDAVIAFSDDKDFNGLEAIVPSILLA